MRAWQHLAPRVQRALLSHRANLPYGRWRCSPLSVDGRVGSSCAARGFASTYPTSAEAAMMNGDDDRHDRDASHLVCGKCSSPISKTTELVFFKWRSGIHMSCMTEAPLQHLRTDTHWDSDENAWKKHKLFCLKCDHAVGMIARVFNSDKILFKAREVAIQMPEHQSPMLSQSGYPSSMLGFTMWSELLLMLESQPKLKSLLEIRRVDNVRDFSVEKKEINTMLMLASDLKSLLDVVDKHVGAMNHVNVLTGLRRASVLSIANKKRKSPVATTPRFSIKSEAPEDDLLMEFPMHTLANPTADKAAADALNLRLWKLVDAAQGIMNFGIGAVQSAAQLTSLASSVWRLNIGRPSILKPMATQAVKLVEDGDTGMHAQAMSMIASAAAHLSSKEIRGQEWMANVLNVAAQVVLDDKTSFNDKHNLRDCVTPLARSMTLTGHFHEQFHRALFDVVNSGLMESKDPTSGSGSAASGSLSGGGGGGGGGASSSRAVTQSWRARIYQIHLDNQLSQRGVDFELAPGVRLEKYRNAFAENEKSQKNAMFASRHLVATALETMALKPMALYAVGDSGYVVDIALCREKIAIEINKDDAYLAQDPRQHEEESSSYEEEFGEDEEAAEEEEEKRSGDRRRSRSRSPRHGHTQHHVYTTLPFADLKASHLERDGWIVVQVPADEFLALPSERKRIEYLGLLIEMATYARAESLDQEEEEAQDQQEQQQPV